MCILNVGIGGVCLVNHCCYIDKDRDVSLRVAAEFRLWLCEVSQVLVE